MKHYERLDTPHVVYRFFGADDLLLYIGVTGSFGRRLEHHKCTREWFHQVQKITLVWYDNWETAAHAEVDAIVKENPVHNLRR